jgi:hypothetical protein
VSSDEELIREGLRAVLRSEETSGKALAAKAQAARQLGLMNGAQDAPSGGGEDAEYPMADLWEVELERRERARARERRSVGARSA